MRQERQVLHRLLCRLRGTQALPERRYSLRRFQGSALQSLESQAEIQGSALQGLESQAEIQGSELQFQFPLQRTKFEEIIN